MMEWLWLGSLVGQASLLAVLFYRRAFPAARWWLIAGLAQSAIASQIPIRTVSYSRFWVVSEAAMAVFEAFVVVEIVRSLVQGRRLANPWPLLRVLLPVLALIAFAVFVWPLAPGLRNSGLRLRDGFNVGEKCWAHESFVQR